MPPPPLPPPAAPAAAAPFAAAPSMAIAQDIEAVQRALLLGTLPGTAHDWIATPTSPSIPTPATACTATSRADGGIRADGGVAEASITDSSEPQPDEATHVTYGVEGAPWRTREGGGSAPRPGDRLEQTSDRLEQTSDLSGRHVPQPKPATHGSSRARPTAAMAADASVQVITACEPPYQVMWASKAWLDLCEQDLGRVQGQTFAIIQGPPGSAGRNPLEPLAEAVETGRATEAENVLSQTRTGMPFSHTLTVEPLRDCEGSLRCLQVASSSICFHPNKSLAAPQDQAEPATAGDAGAIASDDEPLMQSMNRKVSELNLASLMELYDGAI